MVIFHSIFVDYNFTNKLSIQSITNLLFFVYPMGCIEIPRSPIFIRKIFMNEKMPQAERFIKLPEVMNKTGLGRSSIYRKMNTGDFPRSIQLNKNNIVWLESEVNAWMQAQIEKRNQKEKVE